MKSTNYAEYFVRIYQTKEGKELAKNLQENKEIKDIVLTSTSKKTVKQIKSENDNKEEKAFIKVTRLGFNDAFKP